MAFRKLRFQRFCWVYSMLSASRDSPFEFDLRGGQQRHRLGLEQSDFVIKAWILFICVPLEVRVMVFFNQFQRADVFCASRQSKQPSHSVSSLTSGGTRCALLVWIRRGKSYAIVKYWRWLEVVVVKVKVGDYCPCVQMIGS